MGPSVGIVGLGTAGSAAARACAARGMRVIGVERGPLDEAGARWINGVPRWAFAASGVADPVAPELRGAESPYHLVAGYDGPERVALGSVLEVDMRHLVARLQADARAHGAELRGGIRGARFDGARLHTADGPIDADVWIDASGGTGLRMLGQPAPERADLCAAVQQVRVIRDRAGAERFLGQWGARDGEVVCFTSVAGGYSIVNVRVDGEHVNLLTGSLPALGVPSGKELVDTFVGANPWIGELAFGGARTIPLRRAWEVVGRGNVAAIGDAAGQVYAAHGSGIAQQLLAAATLADALADGRGTWGYNVAWQRRFGGLLAGSDLFRRFSADLDVGALKRLIRRKVLSAPMMTDALEQRPVRPPARAIARAGLALAGMPRLGVALVPVLARMRALEWLYARYPDDPARLPAWAGRLERVSGLPAWIGHGP